MKKGKTTIVTVPVGYKSIILADNTTAKYNKVCGILKREGLRTEKMPNGIKILNAYIGGCRREAIGKSFAKLEFQKELLVNL